MPDNRLDKVMAGPTIRLTITATATRIRLSSQSSDRRRFDLRVVTNTVRFRQGGADASVSNDTTNDLTNGNLGRYSGTSTIWPIDMVGPDSQYLSIIREGSSNATIELTRTDSADTADVAAVV